MGSSVVRDNVSVRLAKWRKVLGDIDQNQVRLRYELTKGKFPESGTLSVMRLEECRKVLEVKNT